MATAVAPKAARSRIADTNLIEELGALRRERKELLRTLQAVEKGDFTARAAAAALHHRAGVQSGSGGAGGEVALLHRLERSEQLFALSAERAQLLDQVGVSDTRTRCLWRDGRGHGSRPLWVRRVVRPS